MADAVIEGKQGQDDEKSVEAEFTEKSEADDEKSIEEIADED